MSSNLAVSLEKANHFVLGRIVERAKLLGVDDSNIDGDESLVGLGFFDSLSFLDLLGEIEEEFAIEMDLSGHDPEYFVTLNGLASIASSCARVSVDEAAKQRSIEPDTIYFENLTPTHTNWDDLAKLFRAMYSDLLEFDLKIPLVENGEQIWLDSLRHSMGKTHRIIGCLRNGRLIGYVHGTIKLLPSYLAGNTVGFVSGLYTELEYREKRIAAELFEMIEEWFYSRNVDSVELQALIDNKPAIAFLHKAGYENELFQMRKKI